VTNVALVNCRVFPLHLLIACICVITNIDVNINSTHHINALVQRRLLSAPPETNKLLSQYGGPAY
jgi:hypothetical protein